MKSFIFILMVTFVSASSAFAKILMVGRVDAQKELLVKIETIGGNNSILLVGQESTGGVFNRKNYFKPVVFVDDRSVEALKQLGLVPVIKYDVVVTLARMSDINGWGTGVNGEILRSSRKVFSFEGQSLLLGVRFLQSLSERNYQAFKQIMPSEYEQILQDTKVVPLERGFDFTYNASLVVGEAHLRNQQMIYQITDTIGYFRLK